MSALLTRIIEVGRDKCPAYCPVCHAQVFWTFGNSERGVAPEEVRWAVADGDRFFVGRVNRCEKCGAVLQVELDPILPHMDLACSGNEVADWWEKLLERDAACSSGCCANSESTSTT